VVLERTEMGHVNIHLEKKIKRKRKAGEDVLSIIPEHRGKVIQNFFFQEAATTRRYVRPDMV